MTSVLIFGFFIAALIFLFLVTKLHRHIYRFNDRSVHDAIPFL